MWWGQLIWDMGCEIIAADLTLGERGAILRMKARPRPKSVTYRHSTCDEDVCGLDVAMEDELGFRLCR